LVMLKTYSPSEGLTCTDCGFTDFDNHAPNRCTACGGIAQKQLNLREEMARLAEHTEAQIENC